jgi:hypothetical protein
MKPVDANENPGLAKLPTEVRNKMGYMKKGGNVKHSDMSKDKPMMKAEAEKAVKGHEKRMHKMAKGGVTRADGIAKKGHTKGKTIAIAIICAVASSPLCSYTSFRRSTSKSRVSNISKLFPFSTTFFRIPYMTI